MKEGYQHVLSSDACVGYRPLHLHPLFLKAYTGHCEFGTMELVVR